jgi:hypothetical protein
VCTADVLRRLQYVVYSRCVQKAAICCVQQMCPEGSNVLRRLQYSVYQCVQQMCSESRNNLQQMCSEVCNMLCTAEVFRSLQSAMVSRCVQKSAVRHVQQMCSEDCSPPCSAGVFRRLQSAMFSRCVQKTAVRHVQQVCSEDCHTLHTGVAPRLWFCSFAVVFLWQTSCIAVLLAYARSRWCGRAGNRPYVPAILRHLDIPLLGELLFSCFDYVWKLSSAC